MELVMASKEEAFAEMPRYALFRVADRGEVDFLVPAEEQMKIGEDLFLLRWMRGLSQRVRGACEAAFH